MCGIIGMVGAKADERATQRGVDVLHQRGPDDRGVIAFPHCTLGSTRLAVIDLSPSGHQPMQDATSELAIAFNGEIYNHKELRSELEKKGHRFNTHSDTEVILKAYAEYGNACPEHLDGQFAFAIWDTKHKRLFLARDRFGEKPLYMTERDGTLMFASEIKALFAMGIPQPSIDPVSLDNYLALLYVPPWRSIYKNITPLRPAHRAVWENGVLTEERYWQLTREPSSLSFDDAGARVREMLTHSVRSRMIADVEVGAFLSGGIDSGIVVRLAALISNKPLKTFSMGFESHINELPYAAKIAALAKTEHHPSQVKDNLFPTFLEVAEYFDEPFGDSSNLPTSLVAKFARGGVKVALSGDGGDELFWGYGQYTRYNHLPKLETLKHILTGSNPFLFYKGLILSTFTVDERMKLLRETSAIEKDPTSHIDLTHAHTPLEKINLTDFYLGLPGDILTKVDRSSMMHSLEVRSPFLNHELAQFAYNLPEDFKTDGRRGKLILEKAFSDLLPEEFFTRKKQGFGAPIFEWMHTPEIRRFSKEVAGGAPLIAEYLDITFVRSYFERLHKGDKSVRFKAWALLSLEAWLRTHQHI